MSGFVVWWQEILKHIVPFRCFEVAMDSLKNSSWKRRVHKAYWIVAKLTPALQGCLHFLSYNHHLMTLLSLWPHLSPETVHFECYNSARCMHTNITDEAVAWSTSYSSSLLLGFVCWCGLAKYQLCQQYIILPTFHSEWWNGIADFHLPPSSGVHAVLPTIVPEELSTD